MLRIRPEQLEQLDEAAGRTFEDTLASEMERRLPRQCARVDDVHAFVCGRCRVARDLGIRTRRGLTRYVGLSLVAGRDLADIEAVHKLLTMAGDPEQHLENLAEASGAVARGELGP